MDWEKVAPILTDLAYANRLPLEKELSATELELKITVAKKRQERPDDVEGRAEQALSKHLENSKNKKTRKLVANDRRARRGWKSPRSEQSKHFNWTRIVQDSGPKEALTKFFEDLYHLLDDRDDQGVITQKERRHWVTYWENLKMDCATGELVSERRLDNMLETFLNGKGTPDGITVEVLKALPDDWKTQLARSMSEMCLIMESPAEWMQSATLLDPKVIGATSLAKFRHIAGLRAMRKVAGYL